MKERFWKKVLNQKIRAIRVLPGQNDFKSKKGNHKVMKKNKIEVNFKTSFKEPVMLFGKIFGMKILSAYEVIILKKVYKTLLKLSDNFRENKRLLKKAVLVSMCLYNSFGEKLFSSPIEVLKNLTVHEINFIYRKYFEVRRQTNFYDEKKQEILESVKKHGYQQFAQK